MKEYRNGSVPIPPFVMGSGGKHFATSFQTKAAALEGIVQVDTIGEP